MKFCTLFSGSSGNCTFIEYGDTRILVDAGKNVKTIRAALQKIGYDLPDIDVILLTHGHSDHVSAIKVLAGRYSMPIMGTFGTLDHVLDTCGDVMSSRLTLIDTDSIYKIGDVAVNVFSTPHDIEGSVGYSFSADGKRLTIATDMGYVTDGAYGLMKKSDFVIIESNYDIHMLENGPYPPHLIARIKSNKGHLSNEDCAKTICRLVTDGVCHFMLAHLSVNNNTVELAMRETIEKLVSQGVKPGEVTVDIAPRDETGRMFVI